MTNVLCIYHANCADGLGAAWAVHRALGDKVDFVAAKYGEEPQLSVECKYHSTSGPCTDCLDTGYELGGGPFLGRDVLIVDFSYPLDALRAIAREARSVLVLDHHATAREDLVKLPPPMIGAEPGTIGTWDDWIKAGPLYVGRPYGRNLAAIFDLDRSGAGITWDYLHPITIHQHPLRGAVNTPVRNIRSPLIDLIEDRDLWRFRLPDSRAFHTVLTSYDTGDLPAMFKRMDEYHYAVRLENQRSWKPVMEEGHAILRAQERAVTAAVAGTRRTMRIGGCVVPVANVPSAMASDAGHLLCQGQNESVEWDSSTFDTIPSFHVPVFSGTYYDGADGKRHFSLRSPPGGADVGAVAKRYGGGGHKHASGFVMPLGWEGEE